VVDQRRDRAAEDHPSHRVAEQPLAKGQGAHPNPGPVSTTRMPRCAARRVAHHVLVTRAEERLQGVALGRTVGGHRRFEFRYADLPASVFSHESSAVSLASFPLARLAWHFRMHAISFTQGLRRSGLALRVGRRRDEAGVIATKWRLCTG
jgi:hypothetical protein